MLLHTLNKSADTGLRTDCMRSLMPDDSLLLIEDGVLAVLDKPWLDALPCPLYVLEADLQARGLTAQLPDGVHCVDYAGFVTLCCDHDNVVNWI